MKKKNVNSETVETSETCKTSESDANRSPGSTKALAESKEPIAEEEAIHDSENFESLEIGQYADSDVAAEFALFLFEHGPVFARLVEHFGGLQRLEEAKRYMTEGYHGAFDRVQDYVQELVEDCYSELLRQLPDFIRYHIDYDSIANDFELAGDIFTLSCGGQVHVFDANI